TVAGPRRLHTGLPWGPVRDLYCRGKLNVRGWILQDGGRAGGNAPAAAALRRRPRSTVRRWAIGSCSDPTSQNPWAPPNPEATRLAWYASPPRSGRERCGATAHPGRVLRLRTRCRSCRRPEAVVPECRRSEERRVGKEGRVG